MWYTLNGKIPIPTNDTGKVDALLADSNKRRVAFDAIDEGLEVSTVFLCLDHSFGDDEPPVLFETMILGGVYDQYLWRYHTWEQAETGHNRVVKALLDNTELPE